ncbi:hypothetical protein ZIOFF_024289 [Zingiber officinale]|uniref:dUTP diphosphatase n=1 Tax=Zingiber officinale TaxID=94328 RepID=A0A8J5GS47_ZINOF|nr:hypothetical protein ZIOFF_024289 [Zingiber officinale]
MRFLHIGVIQVRVQILHRQEEGTMLLVVFRDNRWQGDQSIFATMEIDLTRGTQLVYVIPDTMLTVSDFYRNIQVSFLARGYENWQNGEANILVTRGLVGRLSNTPNVGFAYEVQSVVDYLASHGVRALPGRSYNTRDIAGQNWIIRQSVVNIPIQPTEVNTRNLIDGRISISFDNYQVAAITNPPTYNTRDEEVLSDEDTITNHIVAVLTIARKEEEELLVKRISSTAVLPIRRSSGAAGYDLAINRAQDIASHDKALLTTGICIQVPEGLYARIAPRSSAALQGIIIMGGVIDSDYRGEVKILAFNTTNNDIYLNKHECIAQLILEYIATPPVREVETLQQTTRGNQGFGSTTIQVCSKHKANPQCIGCYYCCSDEEYAQEYDFYVAKDPKPDKGKAIQTMKEDNLEILSKKAREYRIAQHKFYEEEAYLDLIEGPPTMALSLAQTTRMLQHSREYRKRLQQQLDSQSSSTNFLCMLTHPVDDYLDYLQYLALQTTSDDEFINPFADGGGEKEPIVAAITDDSNGSFYCSLIFCWFEEPKDWCFYSFGCLKSFSVAGCSGLFNNTNYYFLKLSFSKWLLGYDNFSQDIQDLRCALGLITIAKLGSVLLQSTHTIPSDLLLEYLIKFLLSHILKLALIPKEKRKPSKLITKIIARRTYEIAKTLITRLGTYKLKKAKISK